MRVIIFTGKGGAGVTTLAAATAAAIADSGRKTLAFGLGPGLASAFAQPLGDRPTPLAADLWAVEAGLGRHDEPGPFLAWLRDLIAWRDMDDTLADDIAALPGIVDLARLIALEAHLTSDEYEAVVVDGPAIRHTVDLLAALDAAARSLDRIFPPREPTVLDPLLRAFSDYSTDGEAIYKSGRDLLLRLSHLRQTLSDAESASVRLVLSADGGSLVEVQRAVTAFNLFDYPLDVAFCSQLMPEEAGSWFEARRHDEQVALSYIADSLAPLSVLSVPLQARSVSGASDLLALAGLAYEKTDPAAVLHRRPAQGFSRKDGSRVLSLALPFVEREELAIERVDDALVVHVGERSRTFDLPEEVAALDDVSSAFDGEVLRISFSRRG